LLSDVSTCFEMLSLQHPFLPSFNLILSFVLLVNTIEFLRESDVEIERTTKSTKKILEPSD
jgi:hypothetical protein